MPENLDDCRRYLADPPPPPFEQVLHRVARDQERGYERIQRSVFRRPLAWGLAAVAVGGAAASLSWAVTRQVAPPERQAASEPTPLADTQSDQVPARTTILLRDGSRAVATSPEARLSVVADTSTEAALVMSAGSAKFEVVPNHQRPFVVRCDPVTVEALGTRFEVAYVNEDRVRVAVDEGKVRVSWEDGHAFLTPGQEAVYPPQDSLPPPDSERDQARDVEAASAAVISPTWQVLAVRGEMTAAYESLEREEHRVADEPKELMLAADVARQSGHPSRAATYLERLLRDFPSDPRASVAAYTLGRVRNGLGRADLAAAAFARALQLAPQGALAENALANEALARQASGQTEAAQRLARQYLATYSGGAGGSHTKSMREILGANE